MNDLKIAITFEGAPFEWAKIKKLYLADPAKYTHALQQANWIRAAMVRGLLSEIVKNEDPNNHTSFRADGSVDLVSDFDVTVEGDKKEAVTIAFNREFEQMFGRPSAEVWDTNAYGSNSVEEVDHGFNSDACKNNFVCSSACTRKTDRCSLLTQLRFRNTKDVVYNQHKWAFTTILRNLLNIEEQKWFLDQVNATESKKLKQLFQEAKALFEKYPIPDSIQAQNERYAQALQTLYQIRTQNPKGYSKEFALQYADAESVAGYFASEAYVTMGPFLAIVANDQRQLDVAISQDEYKDSFIENMAYVMHNFSPDFNCSKAFVLAAKYITRAAFAATQVIDTSEKEIIQELDIIIAESTKVRSKREVLLSEVEKPDYKNVEQEMIKNMKGVHCAKDQPNMQSRQELLIFILEYLKIMF